uniref:Spermatogenesis and centriole associated 1 n=1 Tax=Rousettus aegyptiacus TaxID=9407 RepID=A0A7J8C4F9_ROUAE|nr:spermatogenesis and centriole associated 1 [Rousettus aegyptiacus]
MSLLTNYEGLRHQIERLVRENEELKKLVRLIRENHELKSAIKTQAGNLGISGLNNGLGEAATGPSQRQSVFLPPSPAAANEPVLEEVGIVTLAPLTDMLKNPQPSPTAGSIMSPLTGPLNTLLPSPGPMSQNSQLASLLAAPMAVPAEGTLASSLGLPSTGPLTPSSHLTGSMAVPMGGTLTSTLGLPSTGPLTPSSHLTGPMGGTLTSTLGLPSTGPLTPSSHLTGSMAVPMGGTLTSTLGLPSTGPLTPSSHLTGPMAVTPAGTLASSLGLPSTGPLTGSMAMPQNSALMAPMTGTMAVSLGSPLLTSTAAPLGVSQNLLADPMGNVVLSEAPRVRLAESPRRYSSGPHPSAGTGPAAASKVNDTRGPRGAAELTRKSLPDVERKPAHRKSNKLTDSPREPKQLAWERLVGEIAFQLDRRILSSIFPERVRLYGFTVSNIPEKIIQASLNPSTHKLDEELCQTLTQRYVSIMNRLQSLGYNGRVHPALTEQLVNAYGILRERPELAASEGGSYSIEFLQHVLVETVHPNMLTDALLLLSCLSQLSHDDGKPMFIW